MRFVRQLLRDRSAAVAVVALALQLFLLHGATAGFACASAEAAATSGLTVLCDGGASVSAHGRHSPAAPGRCCLDCLCGIACANGAGQLALAPSGDAGPGFSPPARDGAAPLAAVMGAVPPATPPQRPRPRGPPILSA